MYVLDRFEEEIAILVCDADGSILELKRCELPEALSEGDCLQRLADGSWRIDVDETQRRRQEMRGRLRRLFQRGQPHEPEA